MAQYVGYFENNVEYKEGPFVMTCIGGPYRVEVELKGYYCPVLLDISIYKFLEQKYKGSTGNSDLAVSNKVDWLNNQVKLGNIVNKNGVWVVK